MWTLLLGIVLLIITIISIFYEPRKFINIILVVLSAVFIFIGIIDLLSLDTSFKWIPFVFVFAIIPLCMIIIAILLIINTFTVIKKEGLSFSNLLSGFAGFGIIIALCATVFFILSINLTTLTAAILALIIIYTTYFSLFFLGFLIYSFLYSVLPKNLKCDYIVIHGCGLSHGEDVTPLLKGRIEKAVEVYEKTNKKAFFIPSGGKGSDEKISEAEAIKNYLLAKNIPENKIELEDKSTTTYENLKFTKELLDKKGQEYSCILVTNDYHTLRTAIYSKKLKLNAQVVGSKTARYYWPSAFIREYIALMMKLNWLTFIVFIFWIFILVNALMPF